MEQQLLNEKLTNTLNGLKNWEDVDSMSTDDLYNALVNSLTDDGCDLDDEDKIIVFEFANNA